MALDGEFDPPPSPQRCTCRRGGTDRTRRLARLRGGPSALPSMYAPADPQPLDSTSIAAQELTLCVPCRSLQHDDAIGAAERDARGRQRRWLLLELLRQRHLRGAAHDQAVVA